MDHIKEAFKKVKEDMTNLKEEINSLKNNLKENQDSMTEIAELLKGLKAEKKSNPSTDRQINQTPVETFSTDKHSFKPLKHQNLTISNGNEGVSTDRQTDTSTDRQTENNDNKSHENLNDALDILNSLDNLKKEIRIKFKKVTEQEILVFSTIYQLEEEIGYANYKLISKKIGLTESSIRDHVGSIIKKGIPLDKKKINNKQISLSISPNLKKIAPLSTILKLREL